MNLSQILKLIQGIANKEGIGQVYIVGGIARDKVLNKVDEKLSDVDITTGSDSIVHLAKEFAITMRKFEPIVVKQAKDGHFSIFLESGLKIDFSSNFRTPGIEELLKQRGIQNPTELQQEIWSRDFTCNTLLLSLDLQKIKDVSKLGIKDINNKIIRTCLDPENTFKYNINRIIRVIYLACKLGFSVSPDIINWIKNNREYLLQCDKEYLTKNINKAFKYNPARTVYLINKMSLWSFIPIIEDLTPFYHKYLQSEAING